MPLAPFGFGQNGRNSRLRVMVQVSRADEHRARIQKKRHLAAQMNCPGTIPAWRQQDLAPALPRASINRSINRLRLKLPAVTFGSKIAYVPHVICKIGLGRAWS